MAIFENPVNIDEDYATLDQTISIDTEQSQANPLAPEFAASRARRAHQGLFPFMEKNYDEIYENLTAGKEDRLRAEAAATFDAKEEIQRQTIIGDIAKKSKGPLKPEDVSLIDMIIKKARKNNPLTVFEEKYADSYVQYLEKANPGYRTVIQEAQKEIPTEYNLVKESGKELATKFNILETKEENALNAYKNQSYIGYGVDLAKILSPVYYEAQMRGNVPGVPTFSNLDFLGQNLRTQRRGLFKLPIDEFEKVVAAKADEFSRANPTLALAWLAAMKGQTSKEEEMDNAFGFIGLLSGAGTVAGGARLAKSVSARLKLLDETKRAMKDAIRNSEKAEVSTATTLEAVGDIGEAGVKIATQEVTERLAGTANPVKSALSSVHTFFRPDRVDVGRDLGKFGQHVADRIVEDALGSEATLLTHLEETTKANRTPFLQNVEEAMRVIRANTKDLFPGLPNTILDISGLRKSNVHGGYSVDIALGNSKGELFTKEQLAHNSARYHGLSGYTVEGQGGSYYINVTKPVRETSPVWNQLKAPTTIVKEADSLSGIFKDHIAKYRTPEETMDLQDRVNRKHAALGPSNIFLALSEMAGNIRQLAKGAIKFDPVTGQRIESRLFDKNRTWDDWESIVKLARTMRDPNDGKPGYWFKSIGELEEAYLQHIRDRHGNPRLPDEAEVIAYFSYKWLNEADRVLRSVNKFKWRHAEGAETHRIFSLNGNRERVETGWFDGVLRKELPKGDEHVVVVGDTLEDTKKWQNGPPPKERARLQKEINEGKAKLLEIFDTRERPLKGFGHINADERPQFIISRNIETRPLAVEQVPRRGGGHWELDHDWYSKQAIIVKEGKKILYEGDMTALPFSNRRMAENWNKDMDTVRLLIKEGKLDEAEKFVGNSKYLVHSYEDLLQDFKGGKVNGVSVPPRWNLDEPFRVVPRDKMIINLDNDLANRHGVGFRDTSKGGDLARKYQIEFTGERDAHDIYTVADVGTKNNPVYKLEPAKFVDPIPSMNRALSKIVNSTFMDDYKFSAVNNWVNKAANYIVASPEELQRAPLWHFYNGTFREGMPASVRAKLEAEKMQIREFVGIPSKTDAALYNMGQKLADEMYGRFGPKGLQLTPTWLLPSLNDPFQFFRSVVFDAKLGLWSLPQLWVQAQTYSVILGVAGTRYAIPGTLAAFGTQMYRINPKMLGKLDEIASSVHIPGTYRWKPGEFAESITEMYRSGFQNVAGEYSLIDNTMSTKVIKSGGQQFLDSGRVFFKEGEKFVRFGAWHTAYAEFREKNPFGRLTEANKDWILSRADDLSVNMTRASASKLHTGVMSVPAQFYAYQLRLMELFAGKRLTWIERARLLGWQAALYGAPTSLGVSGLPLGDVWKQYAQDNGYVVGDKYIETALMEGIPSMLIGMSTGNFYNISERFGAPGLDIIRDFLRGDKPWWTLVSGAAGSVLAGTFTNSRDGFLRAMASTLMGEKDEQGREAFPVTTADVSDVFKEVSSWGAADRFLAAIATGRWYSKKGSLLDSDISAMNAIWMTFSGTQPQRVGDLHPMSLTIKDREAHEKRIADAYLKEMQRGFRSYEDPVQAERHFTRARTLLFIVGNVREDRIPAIMARTTKDNETLVDKIRWDFYIEKSSPDQRERLEKAYSTIKNLESQGYR